MSTKTNKQKDSDRHRYTYWWRKVTDNTPLIPEKYVTTEQELRDMYREHMASKGKPVIPAEDLKPITQQDTSISEFFKVKAEWEKDKDQAWVRELQRGEMSGSTDAPVSQKMQRIEAGESSLIFDIGTHKTIPFPSDSDKYLQPIRKKEKKEESSWRF